MLTGLKVTSWAFKGLFYIPGHNFKRDPMELNCEGLEKQK